MSDASSAAAEDKTTSFGRNRPSSPMQYVPRSPDTHPVASTSPVEISAKQMPALCPQMQTEAM